MLDFRQFNAKGLRVFVRVDFNVPINRSTHTITDDTRMRAALPTIVKILRDGGSAVVASHLGRPKDAFDPVFSLQPLCAHLAALLQHEGVNTTVHFAQDCVGAQTLSQAQSLAPGQVLLLENLRFHPEEKKGERAFAQQLAALADAYVNDAFGSAHRAHASISGIAECFGPDKKMFGLLMQAEVEAATRVLTQTAHPFCVVLGGAKVEDKLPVIENLLQKADHLLIGGGMAYTFLKAQGQTIGKSICDDHKIDWARQTLQNAAQKGVAIHLPVDHVVCDQLDNPQHTEEVQTIAPHRLGVDIGRRTREQFDRILSRSKTILWNGPMGVFEQKPFAEGTKAIANSVAAATKAGAYSLVGGGDSVAAVLQMGVDKGISHISTGGGALLELFEGKRLPGIVAIQTDTPTRETKTR